MKNNYKDTRRHQRDDPFLDEQMYADGRDSSRNKDQDSDNQGGQNKNDQQDRGGNSNRRN